MLEILTQSSLRHVIWWDTFLFKSNFNFLFVCASVRFIHNKFSSQFSQQLLNVDAWNFNTICLSGLRNLTRLTVPYGAVQRTDHFEILMFYHFLITHINHNIKKGKEFTGTGRYGTGNKGSLCGVYLFIRSILYIHKIISMVCTCMYNMFM